MKKQKTNCLFSRKFMHMTLTKQNRILGIALIALAAGMKVITFPHSINPIIAISLFSGAIINDKRWAFFLPIMAMFASDLMLEIFSIAPGFYGIGQIGNYASLLFVTLLGFSLKKPSILSVTGFSVASSLLFFFLSNTNCYFFDFAGFYGKGITGWLACLTAGLPFLRNGMLIDLMFSGMLFTAYHFLFSATRQTVKSI